MTLHFGLILLQDTGPVNSLIKQQDEQIQRVLLFALIPVVVAFSFFVFVFYRSKREAAFREKETALRLSIAEGELKALRAQMSPHFIFNCMNSIHHFMHSNPAQAADYLIRFSQLIRHVLESSSQRMVTLADEIEANRNYIMLEQLRMNHSFDFVIDVNGLAAEIVHIPPMIIQPLVENAIWHGLSNRGTGGKMDLFFSPRDEKHIQCLIRDNGIEGGTKSEMDLSNVVKKSSMGMALIQERINNLNRLYNTDARVEITKNTGEGKVVKLIIPFED